MSETPEASAQEPASARVTTRTGDDGTTGLLGDLRVPKTDSRVVALGEVDEATSALGVARAACRAAGLTRLHDLLLSFQNDLYALMGDIATTPEARPKIGLYLSDARLEALDALVISLRQEVQIGTRFIVPGDHPASAALDLARAVTRRAERAVIPLTRQGWLPNTTPQRYLNRLSDVLFMLGRLADSELGDASRFAER
ncbi:MAG TPA: cob(I)yrinic acid a,c-diamide adenosyltransferase [Ktedonobacterales bacterium]|nr:cob(I)yrinic acid a,c-diamide adenosyltransferase [Ktedonobacterales bacterium]